MNPQGGFTLYKSMATGQPNESVVKWRMETLSAMRDIEAQMLGCEFDPTLNRYDFTKKNPDLAICNEKGVAYARMIMTSIINKTTIQGNVDSDSVGKRIMFIHDPINKNTTINAKKWGIAPEMRETYIRTITDFINSSMTRSMDDKEREHTQAQSSETTTTQQDLKSMLPNINNIQGG